MLNFIIWNGSPEIFSYGQLALRWYGLLFALGFLLSQQILYYMYKKEGKPDKDVDILTIYMLISTIVGARLGHVIFYQPELLWQSPISVFVPFEIAKPFSFSMEWIRSWHFTGFQGLASHGGAIGILFALWLYSRKRKPNQNYLQVLDRIVILVCLTGCLIRLGNFFNSEIIGKPSNNPLSIVFANRITEVMTREMHGTKPVEYLEIKRTKLPEGQNGRIPLDLIFLFKTGVTEAEASDFIYNDAPNYLAALTDFVDVSNFSRGQIVKEADGRFAGRIQIFGIARHPAQLYEAISCFLLFVFLLWYWSKYKINLPEGRIFGIFMIALWSLRFAYEFLKENQVSFEDKMNYNMGQLLSIPLILVGIWVLIRSYKKQATPDVQGTP